MTKHGLAQAIRAAASPGSALFEETYSPIVAALGKVLAAAEQAGVVRPGLDPDDVILALAGLWEIDPATDWKARAATLYELVFTGLKAGPPAGQITSPLARESSVADRKPAGHSSAPERTPTR
jgi:inactivated superfamily I helicase